MVVEEEKATANVENRLSSTDRDDSSVAANRTGTARAEAFGYIKAGIDLWRLRCTPGTKQAAALRARGLRPSGRMADTPPCQSSWAVPSEAAKAARRPNRRVELRCFGIVSDGLTV